MSIARIKSILTVNTLCGIMFLAMNNLDLWAKWVLDELNKRDWTQADLVRASKKSRGTISKAINGVNEPEPGTVAAICEAFGYPREIGYRIVGLLRPELKQDDKRQELIHLYEMMSEDNKEDQLAYARMRLEKQEREIKKIGKRDPVT